MPQGRFPERIRWASRTIPPPGNVRALRRAVASREDGVLLESAAFDADWARYSVIAVDPIRVVSSALGGRDDPFVQLAGECRPWVMAEPRSDLPFIGGWIGYLAYEAGRFIEPSAWSKTSDNAVRRQGGQFSTLPLSRWGLYDTVLVQDHLTDTWTVAGVELPPRLAGGGRPALADRLVALEGFVQEASSVEMPSEERLSSSGGLVTSRWNFSREAYLGKVERALEYIRAGDIFQVNLARRCRVSAAGGPIGIYERLCEVNPATYAAYIPIGRCAGDLWPTAIVSSSPELFLRVRDGEVTTRPIKGTRPRGSTAREDETARRELTASEKDRAELNMIIDLERNDLGRVCEFGSVRVVSDGEIESLPTVFHRTGTVVGRLRPDADSIDLLRATFPGGSITGAPKVRAMQIINELEPVPRGAYCGAIGCIGVGGDMMLNLAIRTMVVADGHADVMVGSGIVADSDPTAEYEELGAKAAGMLAALGMPTEALLAVAG
jgi:para-aminobenzoate synthetase component 1